MDGGEERGKGREEACQGDDHRMLKRIEPFLEAGFEVVEASVEMGALGIDSFFDPVEALIDLLKPAIHLCEALVDLIGEMVEAVVVPVGFWLLHHQEA